MPQFYKHKTLSKAYYLSILKKLFPEITINSAEKIHGYNSVVLIINKARLFKIPQRKEVIEQYLLEEKIFPIIKKNSEIEVPNILEIRKGNKKFDEFVVEYEIMEGNHLTLEIEKNSFSPIVLENIGQQIGKYLSQIHSINLENFKETAVPNFDPKKWHNEYNFIKENCLHLWTNTQKKWIETLYENFINIWDKKSFKPVFIHGDLGNWHIFSKKEKIIGFIDWGEMRIDDPACDIKWHESNNEDDKIIGKSLLNEYKKTQTIDPHFFERTAFYKNRAPLAKFIKGIKLNDKQRIQDGYKLLENLMKTEKNLHKKDLI